VGEQPVHRAPGTSVRLRLTLSYAGFLVLAGALLLAVVWVFLLRYVPEVIRSTQGGPALGPGVSAPTEFVPDRADLQRAFAPKAAAALAVLLVVGLLGGWVLAGRMLAPLTRITQATRLAAGGSLSHRVRLPGRRDEFRELADSFDAMLARLEGQVAEQQRFAANASHELRTPLSISQTLLEVARRDPPRDPRALLDRLHAVNARAIDLTEALLVLSRADQAAFPREPVDLSLLVEEATETLLPLAEARGVALDSAGDPAPVLGSPALLLQLATNLLHNAVVHNVAEHGTVRVRTSAGPGTAVLTVDNSGDVLTPELVATLTEPFRRGTGRIRGDDAGVGLGLAIVASITRVHSGSLDVTARPGGGLHVAVTLPAHAG
jgi:two-component system sensor histidine kinase VanS